VSVLLPRSAAVGLSRAREAATSCSKSTTTGAAWRKRRALWARTATRSAILLCAVAEPLQPLQDAVVRVAAGEQTAAAACRDLISAEACSASLAKWNSAHLF
jgi:hypothetical protein